MFTLDWTTAADDDLHRVGLDCIVAGTVTLFR